MNQIIGIIVVLIIAIFMTFVSDEPKVFGAAPAQAKEIGRVSFANTVQIKTTDMVDNIMQQKYGTV